MIRWAASFTLVVLDGKDGGSIEDIKSIIDNAQRDFLQLKKKSLEE